MSSGNTRSYVAIVDDIEIHYDTLTDVPRALAVQMGRELGISPVAYLGSPIGSTGLSIWDHLETLADAATTIGYSGVSTAKLASDLLDHFHLGEGLYSLLALVPDPTAHRAMPPGFSWLLHVERFDPRPRYGLGNPLRVGVSTERRNGYDPANRLLTWDDPITRLGGREAVWAGLDMMVHLNTEGRVASVADCAVLVSVDGRFVTPPLAEGALDTAWRRHLLLSGEATEAPLTIEALQSSEQRVCLTPWGEQLIFDLAPSAPSAHSTSGGNP